MSLFVFILVLLASAWAVVGCVFDIACIGEKEKCPFGPRAVVVGLYRLVKAAILYPYRKVFPVTGPDEIIPGVQKPSSVLTDMICAQLLRPDVEHVYNGRRAVRTDKVYVEHDNDFRKNVDILCLGAIRVNDVAVNLSDDEKHRVKVALHRANDFRKKKAQADAEADRQNKSLDAINAFMGVNKDTTDGKDSPAV